MIWKYKRKNNLKKIIFFKKNLNLFLKCKNKKIMCLSPVDTSLNHGFLKIWFFSFQSPTKTEGTTP